MEKVKVSKAVAEAIQNLRNDGLDDLTIISTYLKSVSIMEYNFPKVHHAEFMTFRRIGGDKLMKALVIGYEVEETKEETIKRFYDSSESALYKCGLIDGLNVFGHKVKGVND